MERLHLHTIHSCIPFIRWCYTHNNYANALDGVNFAPNRHEACGAVDSQFFFFIVVVANIKIDLSTEITSYLKRRCMCWCANASSTTKQIHFDPISLWIEPKIEARKKRKEMKNGRETTDSSMAVWRWSVHWNERSTGRWMRLDVDWWALGMGHDVRTKDLPINQWIKLSFIIIMNLIRTQPIWKGVEKKLMANIASSRSIYWVIKFDCKIWMLIIITNIDRCLRFRRWSLVARHLLRCMGQWTLFHVLYARIYSCITCMWVCVKSV